MRTLKVMAVSLAFGLSAIAYTAFGLDDNSQKEAALKTAESNQVQQDKSVGSTNTTDIMSPVGYWMQYNDRNGKAQSVFQIYQDKATGKLEGKLLVPFFRVESGEVLPPDVYCQKCGKGSDNGYSYDYTQPPESLVQGMKLLWGFKKSTDKPSAGDGSEWDDGTLLDPESGHLYSGYLYTQNWGRELYLRGYWGISLIGRTQLWRRITQYDAEYWVKRCGLVKDKKHYAYASHHGQIINRPLWKSCSNIKL